MPESQLQRRVSDARAVSFEKRGSGIAKHYVYTVRVQWSDGSKLIVYRRYNDFFDMHADLLKKFPLEAGVISKKERILPELPKKIYIGRSQVRKVAEKRQEALDQYLQAITKLSDKIVSSPPVERFFEARGEDLNRSNAGPRVSKDENGAKSFGQFSQISGPIRFEHYRAIGGYKKQNREQVDLKKDKEYEVIQKDTTGWWLVKSDQGEGWAPASFLEPVNHTVEDDYLPKSKNERVVSVREYKSKGEFDDELSFPKHAVMKVVYKTLDGWWYVRYNEKNGYVPAAYLTTLRDDSTWVDEDEEEEEEKEAESSSSSSSRKPSVRQKFFGAPPRRETLLDVRAVQKRHTTTMISPLALQKAMQLAGLAQADEQTKPDLSGIREEEEEEEDEEEENTDEGEEVVESEPYRAAADYAAESEEEVSLKTGDMVDVVKKEDNGWWLVVVNEQTEGWAPATYLEPLNVQQAEKTDAASAENPSSDSEDDYVSSREYVAEDAEELSFPEGVIIKVLHKYMDGWWFASYNGKRGYVPASLLDSLKGSPKRANINVPGLALKQASMRNKFLPRGDSILNKDSLYSALNKVNRVPTAIKEELEDAASSNPSSRRQSLVNLRRLSRTSPQTTAPERRMPKIPARPTSQQLERCTVAVRGALQQVSEGVVVVKPTAVRPTGGAAAGRRRSASPHYTERFKPVSDGSGDDSSGGEPSPGTKRRSQNLSPDYVPGNGHPPPLPPSRGSADTNGYSATCNLLQQDPGCSVPSPSSSSPVTTFQHSSSPDGGRRAPPPPRSRPSLPASRPPANVGAHGRKSYAFEGQSLNVNGSGMRTRSHSQGKAETEYREVYYV